MTGLVEILSGDNYITANRKVVQIFSLTTAVYLAEILHILIKVNKKQTADPETGFFTVDREYIAERTTLAIEEQLVCDKILGKAQVLKVSDTDPNSVKLDLDRLAALVTGEDLNALEKVKDIVKSIKTDKSKAKRDGQIITMKNIVSELEADADLRAAYHQWVEAVYAGKKGFLTKASIEAFVGNINAYTTDKMAKLKILEIASATGYTVADWVINSYAKNKSTLRGSASRPIANSVNPVQPVKITTPGVSDKYTF